MFLRAGGRQRLRYAHAHVHALCRAHDASGGAQTAHVDAHVRARRQSEGDAASGGAGETRPHSGASDGLHGLASRPPTVTFDRQSEGDAASGGDSESRPHSGTSDGIAKSRPRTVTFESIASASEGADVTADGRADAEAPAAGSAARAVAFEGMDSESERGGGGMGTGRGFGAGESGGGGRERQLKVWCGAFHSFIGYAHASEGAPGCASADT